MAWNCQNQTFLCCDDLSLCRQFSLSRPEHADTAAADTEQNKNDENLILSNQIMFGCEALFVGCAVCKQTERRSNDGAGSTRYPQFQPRTAWPGWATPVTSGTTTRRSWDSTLRSLITDSMTQLSRSLLFTITSIPGLPGTQAVVCDRVNASCSTQKCVRSRAAQWQPVCVRVRGRHVSPRHVSMPPLLLLARAEAGLGRASWHK